MFSMILAFFVTFQANANVVYFNEEINVFKNSDCEKKNSCDLKEFRLEKVNFRVNLPKGEYSLGTRMRAQYQTSEVDRLPHYGIGQLIKGCQFHSFKNKNTGKVQKLWNIVIPHYEEQPLYRFTDFVIDGLISDPLDWGNIADEPSRHLFYKANPKPGSMDEKTSKYVIQELPTNPFLFVTDRPGTAFATDSVAKNIALQFKTCIYKSTEVPRTVPADKTDFATPLKCFTWEHVFVFNHQKGVFSSPAYSDELCDWGEDAIIVD